MAKYELNMKERITIENFGGLKQISIPLNSINIFIGKQASGKSITAKLVYFFKGIFNDIFNGVIDNKTKTEIDKLILNKFEDYFPSEGWSTGTFSITYEIGSQSITLERQINTKNKLKIQYSEAIKNAFSGCRKLIKKNEEQEEDKISFRSYNIFLREKYYSYLIKELGKVATFNQIFIPAGRSFFANLQSSIFSFLSNNKAIDPFLVEFGSFYSNVKSIVERPDRLEKRNIPKEHIDTLILEILGGRYTRDKNKDYIIQPDNRKIDVSFSSSGQQETLPLSIILKALTLIGFSGEGATIYIEEPEAHLFPSAQKKMVELIATVYNNSRNQLQFIITTHSPYILTSINNLLNAGLLKEQGVNERKLYKIVPKHEIITPREVNAFAMKDGKALNLIDSETGLISADLLDQVSEEISIQFDELLDL